MEITSRMFLKPAYPALQQLGGEKVPLTVFDRAAADMFVCSVRVYPAPAPSNEALKEGLGRAVALYPHLAGRLAVDGKGRRYLHVNNKGVLVIEATVQADLADDAGANVHDLYPTPPEESVGAPLLQIKLNRYKCGGLVVGTACHHQTADGHSMSTFDAVWASAVRQGKDFVAPSPFLDRAATAVPRSTPAPVFDHRSIEFKGEGTVFPMATETEDNNIKSITVHFGAEFIAELKSRVGTRCSTFQCLLAHVWKRITAARGVNPEEFTQVSVAVNCRGRANPPVPINFFGNMVLWAFPRLLATLTLPPLSLCSPPAPPAPRLPLPEMAGLAANGFSRHSLYKWEARLLFRAWYPCPPDMRAGHGFTLGVAGVPIPDAPRVSDPSWSADCHDHFYNELTAEQCLLPEWDPVDPANTARYEADFRRLHAQRFHRWDYPGVRPPVHERNRCGRNVFWSLEGRSLEAVLAHIEAGDQPRLHIPPPNVPGARRTASTPSASCSFPSSSGASSSLRSAPPHLRVPKPEPCSAPARRSGALVINDGARSAPRRSAPPPPKKPKPEPVVKTEAPSSTYLEMLRLQESLATPDDPEGHGPAFAASFNTLVALPAAAACSWSFVDHAAIIGAPIIDLEADANDDEAGPSNRAPPPGDDDGSDGGDWAVMEEDFGVFDE